MADEQVADAPEIGEAASGQEAETSWRDALPDDIREHASLSTIQDVDNLARSYVHAQSMVGADKIPIPGKWADDHDWNEVYTRLGRPDTAGEYELEVPDEHDEKLVGWFAEQAHANGLNNRQANAIVNAYIEMTGEQEAGEGVDIEASRAGVVADLRKEYGNAFDERIELGNGFIDSFGDEGLTEIVLADGSSLTDNPAFIKTLVNAAAYIHSNISEDAVVGNKDNVSITPQEAQNRVNEMMRPDSPYWDRSHPMHEQAVREVQSLMQDIHPEEGVAA